MINWIRGWIETLHIKFFEPELYAALTRPLELEDFGEAPRPGGPPPSWREEWDNPEDAVYDLPSWATGICSAHREPDPTCRVCTGDPE